MTSEYRLFQDLNPLKSRLSFHCYVTESEEVPQKWTQNFDSSLAHNERVVFLSAGLPLLRYTGYNVPIQE